MPMPKGEMDITILADGTVRVETGDMSGVSHKAADDFIKEMARLLAGEVQEEKVEKGVHHHHDHTGTHHHH